MSGLGLGIALLVSADLFGADVVVCADLTGLSAEEKAHFQRGLAKLATLEGLGTVVFNCANPAAVRIRIEGQNPELPETVLGAARVQDGQIRPDIRVFREPIRRLLPFQLPILVGRAMAVVALHELEHFVRQTRTHADRGSFSGALSGSHLLVLTSKLSD